MSTSTQRGGIVHFCAKPLVSRLAVALLVVTSVAAADDRRPRLRDLGVTIGVFDPGPLNAITDVRGVRVGHRTLIEGERIRTGVTAIVPHEGNVFQDKTPAAVVVGNGFGKLMGTTQIMELGEIETPILLTNTLAVAQAAEGIVRWTLAQPGNEQVLSVNAVVGETNDGRLNDIRARTITYQHAIEAIEQANTGAVAEGAVGAGTGTVAFGLKGGIGTSSRRLPERGGGYSVGVLVQTNFGGLLTIAGVPLWKQLHMNPFAPPPSPPNAGSIMIVVATDAPLDARSLERLAARAVFALARTGSTYSNGSGDFAIAFSTHPSQRVTGATTPQTRMVIPTDAISPLFEAVLDATEEAVYNSLLKATDTTSGTRTVRALPIDDLKTILKKYGR